MVSKDELLKLCKLSRLEFTDREFPRLMSDMENIMRLIDKVAIHEDTHLSSDCSTLAHRSNDTPHYEKCSRDQILSGGVNRDGFFFVKRCSR